MFLPLCRSITTSWQPSPGSQAFSPVPHSRGSSDSFLTVCSLPFWQIRAGTPGMGITAPFQLVILCHVLEHTPPFLGWISYAQGSKVLTPRRVSTGIGFMTLVCGWKFLQCTLSRKYNPFITSITQDSPGNGGEPCNMCQVGAPPLIYCMKDSAVWIGLKSTHPVALSL